ncbi:MAG: hypothetical protein LH615_13630 [Ferruginibacter sp.]|nr:hypothetical protein [Ferruginibacter sp.]
MKCTTFPEQGSDISNLINVIFFSAGGGKSSKENFLENFTLEEISHLIQIDGLQKDCLMT